MSVDWIQEQLRQSAPGAYVGDDQWLIGSTALVSGQRLRFKPDAAVIARAGDFLPAADNTANCLFYGELASKCALVGVDTPLQMRKADYLLAPYTHSEFRHVVRLCGCNDVELRGLFAKDPGGDCFYIGPSVAGTRTPCEDITIADCVGKNAYRNSLSILSGRRITIKNVILQDTTGTAPQAGIDIEPEAANDPLVLLTFDNVKAIANGTYGFNLSLNATTVGSEPVSMTFRECMVRGSAYSMRWHRDNAADGGPPGLVEFVDCLFVGSTLWGGRILFDVSQNMVLKFTRCTWRNVSTAGSGTSPIDFQIEAAFSPSSVGGIVFSGCRIVDTINRAPITKTLFNGVVDPNLRITGDINVVNANLTPGAYTAHGITPLTVTVVAA